MQAGFLSGELPVESEGLKSDRGNESLDPYVARLLAQEPFEVQRAIVGILSILRSLAKSSGEPK